jgi:cytochrome c oxidase cbb3-type subunit IV
LPGIPGYLSSTITGMYKYILESVENLNWLAVVSLVLFFSIFVVSTIWIMTKKKDFIDRMSNMPLEDDE